jgi:hypothetical protein
MPLLHGALVTADHQPLAGDEVTHRIEAEILRQVRSLKFGTIEIQVHASRVVQIEKRERQRFENARGAPPAT